MAESTRTSTARTTGIAPAISLPSPTCADVGSFHYGPEAAQGRTARTGTDQRPLGKLGSVPGCERNTRPASPSPPAGGTNISRSTREGAATWPLRDGDADDPPRDGPSG